MRNKTQVLLPLSSYRDQSLDSTDVIDSNFGSLSLTVLNGKTSNQKLRTRVCTILYPASIGVTLSDRRQVINDAYTFESCYWHTD
jgi:hypothetical protein